MTGLTEWGVVSVIVVLMGMAGTIISWTNGNFIGGALSYEPPANA